MSAFHETVPRVPGRSTSPRAQVTTLRNDRTVWHTAYGMPVSNYYQHSLPGEEKLIVTTQGFTGRTGPHRAAAAHRRELASRPQSGPCKIYRTKGLTELGKLV